MKKVMNNKIRPIDANKFEVVTLTNCSDEFAKGAKYILEMIDEAPTLKYEPVKQGRWITKENISKSVTITELSNIIQSDDMGYPLLLCIMSNGEQQWIDVGLDWANKGLEDGNLKLLEWRKNK